MISFLKGFKSYLGLERDMSANTIEAYLHDAGMMLQYFGEQYPGKPISDFTLQHLQDFVSFINELALAANTQARIQSGIRAFFRYLLLEGIITADPTELLAAPKTGRSLPDVLSLTEIEAMMAAIDHSKPEGVRNRAMLETLYSCGLRVSELITLQLSGLYMDIGFLRVIGKGNKERLVPIGTEAVKHIGFYMDGVRRLLPIKEEARDTLFLSRRGAGLSRMMVFSIIKDLASLAGIKTNVHPHTFRHSFATHLVERGADLRAVQEMLGHKSISTTEIYTHLDRSFLRSTLEKFHPRYK